MWNIFNWWRGKSKEVKRWKKEHRQLEKHAGAIIAAYNQNNFELAREHFTKLKDTALVHLMDEDVTFYEMKHQDEFQKKNIIESMEEFDSSFREVKHVLIQFLEHYANPKHELDEKFEETFDTIVGVLIARIEFEETHLYVLLDNSA